MHQVQNYLDHNSDETFHSRHSMRSDRYLLTKARLTEHFFGINVYAIDEKFTLGSRLY